MVCLFIPKTKHFFLTIKFGLEEMRAQFLKGGINAKLKELEDHRKFLLSPSN